MVARTRDELPDVRIITSDRNLGFAGGCNLALRDLDGVDDVALVNSDVLVEPDWLAPLVASVAPESVDRRCRPEDPVRPALPPRSSSGALRTARAGSTGGGSACG